MMIKPLILAGFALLLLGRPEGHGTEAATLLPIASFYAPGDTLDPVDVLSMRNGWNDMHQLIVPQRRLRETMPAPRVVTPSPFAAYLNVFEIIQGKIAGVWVSGSGWNYTVRIRGSMGPPLVVIDGMRFFGYDDAAVNNLLLTIPTADIAYIEVLKGIAETARYGPGAGNGVIVIHTGIGSM